MLAVLTCVPPDIAHIQWHLSQHPLASGLSTPCCPRNLAKNPGAASTPILGSLGADQAAWLWQALCFPRICGQGICRLANGWSSVLPNVNGIKCDHFADKCKQVSFWFGVEIIPQFCTLGTIDFVDADYFIFSSFLWYGEAFDCSAQVIGVWCFLISTLMIDPMSPCLQCTSHNRKWICCGRQSCCRCVCCLACLGKILPLSQSPGKHGVQCHPLISYFTAHWGGDVCYIPWLNTDSLGIFPQGVIFYTPQFLQNLQTIYAPSWLSLWHGSPQALTNIHVEFLRLLHKILFWRNSGWGSAWPPLN
jgi:hypothetical protein